MGIFRLTPGGLELMEVMPGVDIEKDIINFSRAKIVVKDKVSQVGPDLVTGKGFSLQFENCGIDAKN